jgi:aquaporin Z
MRDTVKQHWPEYLMEGAGLGLFMISASLFASLLEYPASPLRHAIPAPLLRRGLMGLAMGATAMGLIYSPWGQQSGAHLNPSVTLTFWRLGKVRPWDAVSYVVCQFIGGMAGLLLASLLLRPWIADPHVNYVATVPGQRGTLAAFAAEALISFALMSAVLIASNAEGLAPYTGLFAATLVMTYIILEAPVSGMSMNPARSFAPSIPASTWRFLWIYFTAPPLGMLLAAELYRRWAGPHGVICAKLHHHNDRRCIFRCGYAERRAEPGG